MMMSARANNKVNVVLAALEQVTKLRAGIQGDFLGTELTLELRNDGGVVFSTLITLHELELKEGFEIARSIHDKYNNYMDKIAQGSSGQGSNLDSRERKINPDLENRFSYHSPKPGQPEQYQAIRDMAKDLAYLIDELCPNPREKALAITNLEQSVFWANASIARYKEKAESFTEARSQ